MEANSDLIQKKLGVQYAVKSNKYMMVKDVDMSKRIVTGYYNMCNYFDSDYDVSMPGCNNRSISERGPQSNAPAKIKHLKDHNWETMPGKPLLIEERPYSYKGINVPGTYFETKMADTTLGNDTLINYQEGLYDNHSFGFQYMDIELVDQESAGWAKALQNLINPEEADKAGFMFLVREYKMFEGSTVGLGACSLTPYLGVKSDNKEGLLLKMNERFMLLSKQLRNGKQSDDTMQIIQMELLQLNQITNELFDKEPSAKDTLVKARLESDILNPKPPFDLGKAIQETKFFNR